MIPCALAGEIYLARYEFAKRYQSCVMVKRMRIVESAILLIAGMFIVSVLMSVFNLPRFMQPFIAVLYGVIILSPVEKIRPYLYKIKRITRRKDSK